MRPSINSIERNELPTYVLTPVRKLERVGPALETRAEQLFTPLRVVNTEGGLIADADRDQLGSRVEVATLTGIALPATRQLVVLPDSTIVPQCIQQSGAHVGQLPGHID